MNEKHILVVDDDVTALDIVSYVFEDRGYTVDRCVDGFAALESVKVTAPDLVLIDLLMPGIDGIETVRRLRSTGLTEVPVIAFTAVDDPIMHEEAITAGCSTVLTKPCPTERLVRAIKKELHLEN